MRSPLFCIITLCLLSLILSCGNDEDEPSLDVVKATTESPEDEVTVPDPDDLIIADPVVEHDQEPELAEPEVNPIQETIDDVLERMRDGYEKEDLDLYLSAFWVDGFHYTSDMATPEDRFDDLIIDELKREGQSAARVFENFQNIGLKILRPAQIINAAPERIEAITHYRIQAFANDGHALEGGFLAWFAEGDARFTFEFREEEWRITKWLDEAFDPQEMLFLIEDVKLKAGINPAGKLVSIWGEIKSRF